MIDVYSYEHCRINIVSQLWKSLGPLKGTHPHLFAKFYYDLPSLMATLINDEEIPTDVLVLRGNDWLVVDCGLISPFTVRDNASYFTPAFKSKDQFNEHVKMYIQLHAISSIFEPDNDA